MPITASGTNRDKQGKSFVDSPSRGENYTAQEVYVGNDSANPIPVEVVNAKGVVKEEYNEVNGTGNDTLTIIDKTVPVGFQYCLQQAPCSGDNKAIYTVELNGSVIYKKRDYLTIFNVEFDFKNRIINAGDNIKIIVENKRNNAASFNSTLTYTEIAL